MNEYAKYVKDNLLMRDKLEQIAEESAELSQAALKLIRAYKLSGNPTPMDSGEAVKNFCEEIQDLLCVLRVFFPEKLWAYLSDVENYDKYERWANRIKAMKELKKEKRCRVMTNRIAEVAKMLGVELGEVFKITDDTHANYPRYYRFTENVGVEASDDGVKWGMTKAGALECLLMGYVRITKLPWKPAMNDTYYYPTPSDKELWEHTIWVDSEYDSIKLSRGLIFKTKEEAITVAEKMLAVAKEGKSNG